MLFHYLQLLRTAERRLQKIALILKVLEQKSVCYNKNRLMINIKDERIRVGITSQTHTEIVYIRLNSYFFLNPHLILHSFSGQCTLEVCPCSTGITFATYHMKDLLILDIQLI